jgi:hypothetical protein
LVQNNEKMYIHTIITDCIEIKTVPFANFEVDIFQIIDYVIGQKKYYTS